MSREQSEDADSENDGSSRSAKFYSKSPKTKLRVRHKKKDMELDYTIPNVVKSKDDDGGAKSKTKLKRGEKAAEKSVEKDDSDTSFITFANVDGVDRSETENFSSGAQK